MKKTTLLTLLLSVSLTTGCFWKKKSEPVAATGPIQLQTDKQASDFIGNYIKTNGGDPAKYEISARAGREGQWTVTAMHIAYPEKKDAARFAPGGYTIYVVSAGGQVINSLPGRPTP